LRSISYQKAHLPIDANKLVSLGVSLSVAQIQILSSASLYIHIPWLNKQTSSCEFEDEPSEPMRLANLLRFGRANDARTTYFAKDVRRREAPWSRFEYITPPKFEQFQNENLSGIRNADRQRRAVLGLVARKLRTAPEPTITKHLTAAGIGTAGVTTTGGGEGGG
jgi:hypothetical protein